MEHINKVEIRGNVGTVRLNEHNGKKVANLSVVTELLYKSREGVAVSETTWHNVVAWSGKEIADLDMIVKGTPVHVTGRIRTSRHFPLLNHSSSSHLHFLLIIVIFIVLILL